MKRIAYIMMLAGVAALAACSTDEERGTATGQDRRISFTAVEASQWQTRGAQIGRERSMQLKADGLGQPLFMTTTVADGFQPRKSAAGSFGSSGSLCCGAAAAQWPATRGTMVTGLDQLDHFGVSAFLEKTENTVGYPGYFYNLKASKSGDDYVITQNYYWPATDECLHFYAYYPYNSGADPAAADDNTGVTLSPATLAGPQKLTYTVDSVVTRQADLMTAVAIDDATPGAITQPTVELPFRHELCAVSFKIADELFPETGGIVSIALKGIYGSGTMTINRGAPGTWDFVGQTRNAVFADTINKIGTGNLQENGKMIANDHTFLMIPQELTDNAVIEMVYQDDAQNYTLTASLKEALKITDTGDPNVGRAFFEAGKTVTFALSSTTLSTLKIGTITWPDAYEASATLPKHAYADEDQAGLYVLSDDDKTFAYKNIPVTYDADNHEWLIDHNTAAGVVYCRPGYHYYLYYPYTPTPSQDYPLDKSSAVSSYEDVDIFSSLITGWGRTVFSPISGDADRRDQSQQADFTAADLHIAQLTTAGGSGHVSTVGATMKHAMGLAVFTLGTTSNVPQVIHRSLDTDATFTWDVANGTTSVTASGDFAGKTYIPYKLSNTTYLYWVKPSQTTSVSSSGADQWNESVSIALNQSTAYPETSPRTTVETSETVASAELEFTVGSVAFKVVAVGGGSYTMAWSRYNEYEVTGINGTLSSFWMGQTEVTRGLWGAVMGGSKHADGTALGTQAPAVSSGDGNYPIAMVSHIDIMGSDGAGTDASCFIKKLNAAVATQLAAYGLTGRQFTLPSEAQWQWAAMGGRYTHNYTYAGGNDLNTVAWNSGNANSQTHPVKQKAANELALYDMTGNVWEWCRDWFCSEDEIVVNQGTDYVRTTQASSSYRVYRGGSWYYATDWCPVSRRSHSTPSYTLAHMGLRLLLQ